MSDVLGYVCPKIQKARNCGAYDFGGALRAALPLRGVQLPVLPMVSAKECSSGANGDSQPACQGAGRGQTSGLAGRRSSPLPSESQL